MPIKSVKVISFCLAFFGLSLSACKVNHLSKVTYQKLTVKEEYIVEEDAKIAALIQPYQVQLQEEMGAIIGTCSVDLKKQRPESNLGNWMADAIHRQAEKELGESVDFALQNYGGIRIPEIKKGDISKGKIYELMPFDNKVLVLYLNGTEVTELIQHIVKSRGWPLSYGIKVQQMNATSLAIKIGDQALEKNTVYKVAVPDYVANGGSGCAFLKDKKRTDLGIFIRDALVADLKAYTTNGQVITNEIEGRFVLQEEE